MHILFDIFSVCSQTTHEILVGKILFDQERLNNLVKGQLLPRDVQK
jgi:hypothetical protein